MVILVGWVRVIGLVVSLKASRPSNDHAEPGSQLGQPEYSSSMKAPKNTVAEAAIMLWSKIKYCRMAQISGKSGRVQSGSGKEYHGTWESLDRNFGFLWTFPAFSRPHSRLLDPAQ